MYIYYAYYYEYPNIIILNIKIQPYTINKKFHNHTLYNTSILKTLLIYKLNC